MAMMAEEAGERLMNIKRQLEIGGGIALVGISAFLAVSAATWNVNDPSWSQSNRNLIENAAGGSGAVAADLMMQILGLGAALFIALPLIWGVLLLTGKGIDRVSRRAWLALGGIALACAAVGCMPATEHWPLPIGLGGVLGDIVLKFPALAIGGYPSGFFAIVFGLLLTVPAAWLYLNGAGILDRRSTAEAYDTYADPRHHGGARAGDLAEDDGESRFQLVAGALAHAAFSVRSAFDRFRAARAERRREFGDRFDDWNDQAAPAPVVRDPALLAPEDGYRRAPVRVHPAHRPEPHMPHATMPDVPMPKAPYGDPRAHREPEFGRMEPEFDRRTAQRGAPIPPEVPAQPVMSAPERTIRVQMPTQAPTASYYDPFADADGSEDEAFVQPAAPRMQREAAAPAQPAMTPPAADPYARPQQPIVTGRFDAPFETPAEPAEEPLADDDGYEEQAWAAYDEAQYAAEPEDPYANDAWFRANGAPGHRTEMAQQAHGFEPDADYGMAPAGSEMMIGADDRVAPTAGPAPADGGWRGLLPANIIAFPGRRPKDEVEDLPPSAPAPRQAAPQQPAAPSADSRRAPPPMPRAHGPADQQAAVAQGMGAAEGRTGQDARLVPQSQVVTAQQQALRTGSGRALAMKPKLELTDPATYELPSIEYLTPAKEQDFDASLSEAALAENARLLEGVLKDFGVKGEIMEVRPGPVVTLYELEPAPGIKSSRVIGLADDIARSMSAIAARVAVIPGKNAIGIELPNARRETVYFREMIGSESFAQHRGKLPLALGKTIGGEPVIADLAKMPHLLVAGTTGSGKSVAINTMIASLLYRHSPAECRLIMIDPKMLELSIYDGIPHLLAPVVTDPKKAVVALKWTVKEMEDRYRKMSKVGVRNIDGFNQRVRAAMERGETMSRTVQTGFDRETGEPIFETEEFDLRPLPYIVVIIDEMADLMMVAGKEIEGAVQRLAQMARAAGIHVIMATQRPSTDVITGTIKANFPTRISFQVTSKIDSRVMLGESGAEQLLGMGDMLFMTGGGRIQRVHGPFVDDGEVERIVTHLKAQGVPDYLDAVLEDDEEDDGGSSGGSSGKGNANAPEPDENADLYDQAVAVVLRDGKASTSYIQRRLGIGYNRAASIIERMEKEGVVGPANHAGKREILVPTEEETM